MITLKQLLEVCEPDWIDVGGKFINARKKGIPENLLDLPVKGITGWDDGLTVEVVDAITTGSPCTDLSVADKRERRERIHSTARGGKET